MMNGMPKQDSSERAFGHCQITWSIENYGLATWQENWEVRTPEFVVCGPGSQKTKWTFMLEMNTNENISMEEVSTEGDSHGNEPASGILTMHLERTDNFQTPETVWVDWKVSCLGINGNNFAVAQGKNYFNKKHRNELPVGIIMDLEREFLYNSGVMTFICQMIVQDENNFLKPDSTVNLDLKVLSEDLQRIFMEQKFCDVKIKVDDRIIFAHSAVLFSRSTRILDCVKKIGNFNVVSLPEADYDGMLKTLEYIYSGDLQDVLKPSLSTYDSVIRMNLNELFAHYIPEEKIIRTSIHLKKLTYTWCIKNFKAIEERRLLSPILTNDIKDAAWQIHLYPNGINGKTKYVAVCVECIDGEIVSDSCVLVQCAVRKEKETYQTWKTLQQSKKDTLKFEDQEFVERRILLDTLGDDVFRLAFKVRMCTGKKHSITEQLHNFHVPYSEKLSLKKLSKDLLSLRKSSKYTDITLQAGGKEIKAHKFILCARSSVLSNMLLDLEGDCLTLKDVSPEALNILLDYMYSAVLNVSGPDILNDVYEASEKYAISGLRNEYSRLLQDNLTIGTLCDTLILAYNYGNMSLKDAATEFIRGEVNILEQDLWKELKLKIPRLCNEIEWVLKESEIENVSSREDYKLVPTVLRSETENIQKPLDGNKTDIFKIIKGNNIKVQLYGNNIQIELYGKNIQIELHGNNIKVETVSKEVDSNTRSSPTDIDNNTERLVREINNSAVEPSPKETEGGAVEPSPKETEEGAVETSPKETEGGAVETSLKELDTSTESVSEGIDCSGVEPISEGTDNSEAEHASEEIDSSGVESVLEETASSEPDIS